MSLTRREFLGSLAATGAGAFLAPTAVSEPEAPARDADFTFVHLTDMHVTHKRKGDEGYRKCIESVLSLKPRPAFALMGGDLAFDGLYTPKADFEEQIRLYKEVTSGLNMPVHNCMGNHDALGWSARRKCSADDPDIGKKLIMDRLEWEKPYYSFDFAGWHFAVLDSIYPIKGKDGPSYEPRIGAEQLEWLAGDLGAAGDRPKVCLTHIAAFCNVGQLNGDREAKAMNGSMVLWDTRELREILERHKVLALLQGHSHRIEEYRLGGVWYLTSAAVSGAWWAGSWVGSPPGYTVLRCKGGAAGGRPPTAAAPAELTWEHRAFDWQEQLEPEDELERKKIAEQRAFEQEQRRLLERERAGPREK